MNQEKSRNRKNWILVTVVVLMLATMGMYLASMDEAEPEAAVDRVTAPNL